MTKKEQITKLLKAKKSYDHIKLKVGCSKSTISYHAKQLGLDKGGSTKPPYDWELVRKYYEDHTTKECLEKFGMNRCTWSKAKKRGDLKIRKRSIPDHKFFVCGKKRSGVWLSRRLIQDKHKAEECEVCGLGPIWNGKKLTLHVDHINGNKKDNRLENLRIICPNCHQQTPSWGGKNIGL